jgi:uncharacterized membrane protein
MVGGYATLFAALSVARHRAFATGRFDLGNMVQAIWSTLHGRFLETTDVSGEQFSRLGAHVDPILALFAPLYALWPSPEALLVAQAAIVALGALPAFWLGRRWLGDDRLAVAAAAVYLLYAPLQFATLFDFHPATLAAPLLFYCIWAAEEGRLVVLGTCGALAALCQEQMGLAVVMIALWMAVRHPARRGAARILASAAALWVAVATLVIIPGLSLGGGNPHTVRYRALGSEGGDVLTTLLTRPWEVIGIIATPSRAAYLAVLLLPLLGLSLLAPLLAAGALPQLVINLLADDGPAQTIEFHYAAGMVPFLVASAILGLARLRERPFSMRVARILARPRLVAGIMVGVVAAAGVRLGPLPLWGSVPLGWAGAPHHAFRGDDQSRALQRAVAMVPDGVPVAASNAAAAHLSARRRIFLFPEVGNAKWILVSGSGRTSLAAAQRKTLRGPQHAARLLVVERDPAWKVVLDQDGIKLFRRRPAGAPGEAASAGEPGQAPLPSPGAGPGPAA